MIFDRRTVTEVAPKEQRYFPRWNVIDRVSARLQNNENIYFGQTRDLSCHGVCISIESEELTCVGEKLFLTIHLAMDAIVGIEGEVRWCNRINGKNFLGIVFYNLSEKNQNLILDHAFGMNKKKLAQVWFRDWN